MMLRDPAVTVCRASRGSPEIRLEPDAETPPIPAKLFLRMSHSTEGVRCLFPQVIINLESTRDMPLL